MLRVCSPRPYQNGPRELKHADDSEDDTVYHRVIEHGVADSVDPECRTGDGEESGKLKKDGKK